MTEIGSSTDYHGIYATKHEGAVIRDNRVEDLSAGRGILVTGSRDALVKANQVARTSGTLLSLFGTTDSTVMGNTISETVGTRSNGMSFYLGNTRLKVVFNTVTMLNGGAGITHQDADTDLFAFNTIVGASGMVLAHWPETSGGDDKGNHTYANIVVLTLTDNRAFPINSSKAKVGSTVINNISDGMSFGGVTGDPFALRTKNYYTRKRNGVGLDNTQDAATGEIQGMDTRDDLFIGLDGFVDLRPSTTGAGLLSDGSPWVLDHGIPGVPSGGVSIEWIGRYRPDGTEAFDWTSD